VGKERDGLSPGGMSKAAGESHPPGGGNFVRGLFCEGNWPFEKKRRALLLREQFNEKITVRIPLEKGGGYTLGG